MLTGVSVYQILISCPSDVVEEIKIIEDVVQKFNDTIGLKLNLLLHRLHWSKNVIPQAGDQPQALMNKQIVDRADAVTGVFNNRIGT